MQQVGKIIFLISLVCLLFLNFFILPKINIENPLVKMYSTGNAIFLPTAHSFEENLLKNKSNLSNPNVIFILLESVSSNKISYYGYERNTTPNIDSLAEKSLVFTSAHTTATHSDYAQPAYLSSNYILENDYRNFFNEKGNKTFVWDVFKGLNYTTLYISSQDDLWAGMNNYLDYTNLDLYWYSLSDEETDYGRGLGKKDLDEKTMQEVIETLKGPLIKQNLTKEKPFFLYLNLQNTHKPWNYPEQDAIFFPDKDSKEVSEKEININKYDNALFSVDLQVGILIDYLKEENILNNTVIILSSDHGDDLYGRHNIMGHGLTVYEEEIKVPLIFYFPDLEPKKIKEEISHINVLPTVLNLLNIENSSNYFDGKPFRINEKSFFYAQSHKYLIGMIENNIKVIIDLNRNLVEVYDLSKDPLEEKNLVETQLYDSQIIELLNWHYCQINHDSDKNYIKNEKYCEQFK